MAGSGPSCKACMLPEGCLTILPATPVADFGAGCHSGHCAVTAETSRHLGAARRLGHTQQGREDLGSWACCHPSPKLGSPEAVGAAGGEQRGCSSQCEVAVLLVGHCVPPLSHTPGFSAELLPARVRPCVPSSALQREKNPSGDTWAAPVMACVLGEWVRALRN